MNWEKYAPYFKQGEFACKHTGKCEMSEEFMDKLLALRLEYGRPMTINSGYRHWSHPEEVKKGHKNGEHTKGRSADIGIANPDAAILVAIAFKHGFTRIGVSQKGTGARFIHLGLGGEGLPTPAIWSY